MLPKQMTETLVDQNINQRNNFLGAKADMVLHTTIAQSFFDKFWSPGRVGLKQFGTLTNTIYHAYKKDDPYAHWVLLKTYKKLIDAIEKCKEISGQLDSYFKTLRAIKPRFDQQQTKWMKPLNFTVFCAYLGAELLGQVDFIVMQLNSLKQFGLFQTGEIVTQKKVIDLLQNVFSFPFKWKNTEVTRKDILQNNKVAQNAREILKELINELGELPADVLNKNIEFSFLPKI